MSNNRDAGVVDAGGQGLSVILEGARRHLRGEDVAAVRMQVPEAIGVEGTSTSVSENFLRATKDELYGYCTQYLVEGRDLDPDWVANGYMEQVVELVCGWVEARLPDLPAGTKLDVWRLDGRTPTLFLEVPGTGPGTVLLYGHLDKQPPMTGWSEGLGPWQPVMRDDKL